MHTIHLIANPLSYRAPCKSVFCESGGASVGAEEDEKDKPAADIATCNIITICGNF